MRDPREDHRGRFGFDIETMTKLGRAGSLPPSYLDAWRAHLLGLNAKLDAEIRTALSEAADDPEMLDRLNRPFP